MYRIRTLVLFFLVLFAIGLIVPLQPAAAQVAPTPTRRVDPGSGGGGIPTAPPAPTALPPASVGGPSAATPPPIGGGVPPSAFFANLTFSTTADGPVISAFSPGTPQVFARFDFANVPAGTTITRNWYLNNALYLTRTEAWTLGGSGRVVNVSIFDFTSGLPSGSYYVTFSLAGYPAATISGSFVILGQTVVVPPVSPTAVPQPNQSFFTNLTTSTYPAGPAIYNFPLGTTAVYIRFNYFNVPIGTTVRREWFLNNTLYRIVEEPWSAYWGNTGRLTHIALIDYAGLPAGNWLVRVSLPAFGASIQSGFTIAGTPVGGAVFSRLSFSTTVNGPSYGYFYFGTREIFARWRYTNPPTSVWLVRRWYRNGVLFLTRREGWYRAGTGVSYVSLYDYQYGISPGTYYIEIELEGVPNSRVAGSFRVG